MTGHELREWRNQHGVSAEELGAALGVTTDQVAIWEDERDLKRSLAGQVKYAVWELYRDRLAHAAGIPTCSWVETGHRSLRELGAHLDTCDTCRLRIEFVERNVDPPPSPPGIIAKVTHFGNRLTGWKKSAFAGGMLLVYMAGVGAPIMLVMGVARGDSRFVLGALGLLVLLFTSGAAGGVAYYIVSPLRTLGILGHYISWTLVLYAYLFVAGALVYAGEAVIGAQHEFDPADTTSWLVFAGTGLIFGVATGYAARERKPARSERTQAAN